jgi:hypothetical protein
MRSPSESVREVNFDVLEDDIHQARKGVRSSDGWFVETIDHLAIQRDLVARSHSSRGLRRPQRGGFTRASPPSSGTTGVKHQPRSRNPDSTHTRGPYRMISTLERRGAGRAS